MAPKLLAMRLKQPNVHKLFEIMTCQIVRYSSANLVRRITYTATERRLHHNQIANDRTSLIN